MVFYITLHKVVLQVAKILLSYFFRTKKLKMADSSVIIPIIDLKEGSDKSLNKKIREAGEKWGCFMVKNHGVSLSLMAEMKKCVKDLHELPCEVKSRNKDVIIGSGYNPPNELNPFYESFGLFDMASPQAVNNFCDLLDASSLQRETMLKYGKATDDLARDLARRLAESYGVKETNFVTGWPSQCRMNKYHNKPEAIGKLGVILHTDPGLLTILQGDEDVGGLEVMDDSTGSFFPINILPNTLFVNFGDFANIWSNGRLCNAKHRVQCIEAKERITIASFLLGPVDRDLEAPEEFVNDDHPRLYKPISDIGLKKIRLSKILHAGEALKFVTINGLDE